MTQIDRYKGDGKSPVSSKEFPYIANSELVQAVNMAIVLKRPLLVKGPPGCGKTRLAASIAHELNIPLYEWYVKSTSRAQEGLYKIDMIRRLQDAQLKDRKAQKLTPYIQFGPLGEALRKGTESVVLIDEIDKADIDFPNDLLRELEEKKFTIEELNEAELSEEEVRAGFQKTYYTDVSPIIIITSNDEKELPDAFVRRCLFYYIEFPSKEQLAQIVRVNVTELDVDDQLINLAIDRLNDIRSAGDFRKQPATSELIDWIRILCHWNTDLAALSKNKNLTSLPFWPALLKHQQDLQYLTRQTLDDLTE